MILVTGGAGFIGSIVAGTLRQSGIAHVVYDSLVRGTRAAVGKSPLIEGDLRDRGTLREVFARYKINQVMHFGALVSVTESLAQPDAYFLNNVIGTYELLEAMREAEVKRIVFSSTAAVYGLPRELPIEEDHPLGPTNPYGESKLAGEALIQGYAAAHDFSATILRYFNAAGAWPEAGLGPDRHLKEDIVSAAMRVAGGESPALEVFGEDYPTPDGTAIRDFVHVRDLAQAHVLAADTEPRGTRIYNLGSGSGYSVRQVVQAVELATGRPLAIRSAPRRAGDPHQVVASCRRAGEQLGWRPQRTNLEAMIADAWEYSRTR